MNKLIILFLITFSTELFSQSWQFMYKDDFLPIAPFTGEHERLSSNNITINNNNIIVSRGGYDNLIIIYNQKTKEWKNISIADICSKFKEGQHFREDDFTDIKLINYDENGNIWAFIFSMSPSTGKRGVISIINDTARIYKKVYNTELKNFFNIGSIYDLKVDKKGDVWAIIDHYCYINDTLHPTYYSLCKFKDSCFVTINNPTSTDFGMSVKKNIAFDNLGRVWHSNADTLYLIENEKVINKISTNDFPDGYSYISRVVVNSKNVVYFLNYSLMLYKYDGNEYSSYNNIWEVEKYINHNETKTNYYMCIDSLDNVWISGPTHNLFKIDSLDNFTRFEIPAQDLENFYNFKQDIEADKYGKIWMTQRLYGILIFNPDTLTSVEDFSIESRGLPDVWLRKLYPNPSNSNVTVEFFLERSVQNECKVIIYNTLGMEVKEITEQIEYNNCNMSASLNFSVSDLPSGAYILTISAGNSNMARLMLVGL